MPSAKPAPNIVFILADDLSWNLVNRRFMPHVAALERRGETFDHYFVADSLCCPSRATIFTGDYPHDTHVLANLGRLGGYGQFQRQGLGQRTFAVALQRRGYATSLLGKYLNGYGDPAMRAGVSEVAPGWSDWHVSNESGYREFDYLLDDNGRPDRYGPPTGSCVAGGPEADIAAAGNRSDEYGVDVLGRDATRFIRQSAHGPFALEVATFAPHRPYTPSPRNACDFPRLKAPAQPGVRRAQPACPRRGSAERPPLSRGRVALIDQSFRRRAQSVESVDALVARVESELKAEHVLKDTYIVFSSDNGYHMGEHRLLPGKRTAFDSDIRVPLIVAGPGVPRGRTMHQVVQNTDLAPTFVQLGGGTPDPQSRRAQPRAAAARPDAEVADARARRAPRRVERARPRLRGRHPQRRPDELRRAADLRAGGCRTSAGRSRRSTSSTTTPRASGSSTTSRATASSATTSRRS